MLLIALVRTLWRLSLQDMHDWLVAWPALALACGLPLGRDGQPRIPSPSQQCKRAQAAAYWGLRLIAWIHATLHATAVVP